MKKYFPKIFGNTDTKMRLSDAIIDKTLPHAILIVGPHGSGKSTLATEIAASANCLNQDSENHNLPCGICNNCKRIYSGNFPELDPEPTYHHVVYKGLECVFNEEISFSKISKLCVFL